ncbi:MAG: protein-tyrosine-phosphatase [Bacteroidota bacterium]
MPKPTLFVPLAQYCKDFEKDFQSITTERRTQLNQLSKYICEKQLDEEPCSLVVICTHNARRSHMAQLWLATAAAHYGIQNIKTFSGGTEATAFDRRSVAALKRAGFEIVTSQEEENPTYFATYGFSHTPLKMFSKKYDHEENPNEQFAAILVCSDADEKCPTVLGAEQRFVLAFDDPKKADDTLMEKEIYDERVRQIGLEMWFVMAMVKFVLRKIDEKAEDEKVAVADG